MSRSCSGDDGSDVCVSNEMREKNNNKKKNLRVPSGRQGVYAKVDELVSHPGTREIAFAVQSIILKMTGLP